MTTNEQSAAPYYDEQYFAWQKSLGDFGAWADKDKFAHYLTGSQRVLDFGCGGGMLLAGLKARERYGVEPNPTAGAHAATLLDKVFTSAADLPSEFVDLIISTNALEHTLHPLSELQHLFRALTPGGKIVMVVPCENITYAYVPNDKNHHLYSWSPMCLGNLLGEAGFSVIESKAYIHKWPPFYEHVAKLGWPIFNALSRIRGQLDRKWFQVRAVGVKPTL